jgi:phosphoribosylamine--glycine ligase
MAVLPVATLGIVLAASGYPETPTRGDEIAGLGEASATGALIFHAGTKRNADGRFVTDGGRVLTVVGRGSSLEAARGAAERGADAISWAGVQRRHDIGTNPRGADVEQATPAGAGR